MSIRVEVNYNRRKNEVEIYANDNLIKLPFIQGKLINEWFNEVKIGGRIFKGFLIELSENTNSTEIELEFISDAKSKSKFYEHLRNEGVDVVDDEELTVLLEYTKIAQSNYLTAIEYLDIDEEVSRNYFTKAAKLGHVNAQYELGKCYYYSIGGDFDEAEAIYWFKEAMQAGCVEAKEELFVIEEEAEQTRRYNREMLMLTEEINSIHGLQNITDDE